MPLKQDLAEFCIGLKIAPGLFCVTLPGGAELCVQADVDVPDAADAARKLFEQANSALTPLVPIFNVIDAVISLKNCVEAIPDALGGDIGAIRTVGDCVPDVLRKVDALIALLPQTSLPILAAQIIDSLIAFLRAYRAQILRMIARLNAIIRAQTRAAAAGNTQLEILLDCATGNLDAELVNYNSQFTPIQRLIGVVNAFLELAGLPCIPAIQPVTALNALAVADIDKAIELLEALRALLPVPTLDPNAPAAFSKACDTEFQ